MKNVDSPQSPPEPPPEPTPLALPLEWRVSAGLTDYDDAITQMQDRAKAIAQGTLGEMIWLLEHPPIYTAGTSARDEDLLNAENTMTRQTGRGGEWTYHGPGQRVIYVMLDVSKRGQDIRKFIRQLESWAMAALADCGITANRRDGFPGVWVGGKPPDNKPDKIAAIGVRITKWVSWHGMAINHSPDLRSYDNIIPCGIHDGGITSIITHRPDITMANLDASLARHFAASFSF